MNNIVQQAYEKELIKSAKNNDKKCLYQLIKNYESYLKNLIKKYPLNREQQSEAYDCAIIGFITALNSFDFKKGSNLMGYAFPFVKKEIVSYVKFELSLKKRKFYARSDKEYEEPIAELVCIDSVEEIRANADDFTESDTKIFVDSILNIISKDDKEFIQDIYFKNKSVKEIASENKTDVCNVYNKKNKILKLVRKEVVRNDA